MSPYRNPEPREPDWTPRIGARVVIDGTYVAEVAQKSAILGYFCRGFGWIEEGRLTEPK